MNLQTTYCVVVCAKNKQRGTKKMVKKPKITRKELLWLPPLTISILERENSLQENTIRLHINAKHGVELSKENVKTIINILNTWLHYELENELMSVTW